MSTLQDLYFDRVDRVRELEIERDEARAWARKMRDLAIKYQKEANDLDVANWDLIRERNQFWAELKDYKQRAREDIEWLECQLVAQDDLYMQLDRATEDIIELDDDNALLQEMLDETQDIAIGRAGILRMFHDMLHEAMDMPIGEDPEDYGIFDLDDDDKPRFEFDLDFHDIARQMAEWIDGQALDDAAQGDPSIERDCCD
jgi:hypothetical protein